jgi:elongation factor Ts
MEINKTAKLQELREKTSAGMNDCRLALEEADYDLEKAVEIVKARGLVQTSRISSKISSEGRLILNQETRAKATITEINCGTDFTANSPAFIDFAVLAGSLLSKEKDLPHFTGDLTTITVPNETKTLEEARQTLMGAVKENIVVRRWAQEEITGTNAMVFSYLHSNSKIGTMVSLEAPAEKDLDNADFREFGNNLAMQIAAMAPLAVSVEQIAAEETQKQKGIFELQLREAGKKEEQFPKILEGKFRRWFSDVALLEQESIFVPKKPVRALRDELSTKLCGEKDKIKILSFIRMVVGDQLSKTENNLGEEVSKLLLIEQQ